MALMVRITRVRFVRCAERLRGRLNEAPFLSRSAPGANTLKMCQVTVSDFPPFSGSVSVAGMYACTVNRYAEWLAFNPVNVLVPVVLVVEVWSASFAGQLPTLVVVGWPGPDSRHRNRTPELKGTLASHRKVARPDVDGFTGVRGIVVVRSAASSAAVPASAVGPPRVVVGGGRGEEPADGVSVGPADGSATASGAMAVPLRTSPISNPMDSR